MAVTILGIESSCDDTSAAVLQDGNMLANLIANQDVHKRYGGVVPELASRAHQQNIVPVVDQALERAGVTRQELSAVAFTKGPGLMGSLLVGTSFAKALAMGLGVPLIEVNHMEAHVLAHFIEEPRPSFPFLCLTVSGGHTQIIRVDDYLSMELIGETRDDAAGEAFDKTGKLLGLPYPSGPVIDKRAAEGNPHAFSFPEPKIPGYNFSFSGLKTSILYFVQEKEQEDPDFINNNMADICASVQYRIISILLSKLKRAARERGIDHLAIAGGVSANRELRQRFHDTGQERGWHTCIPRFEYCTDNAAMIAMAGYYKYLEGQFTDQSVTPVARYPINR